MSKAKIQEFGEIEETIFLDLDKLSIDDIDTILSHVSGFSVDIGGAIRKNVGMIAYDNESDNDPRYVPRFRYEITTSPWNSHSFYVVITLPNPAVEFEHYQFIRNAVLAEINRRLKLPIRVIRKLEEI